MKKKELVANYYRLMWISLLSLGVHAGTLYLLHKRGIL